MANARVTHFEITADDTRRAVSFYRDVFGWELAEWEGGQGYHLAHTGEGPGIDGAVTDRTLGQATVVTVQVDRPLEAVLDSIERCGGTVTGEIGEIPGVGRHAYVRDSESNLIGLVEPPSVRPDR